MISRKQGSTTTLERTFRFVLPSVLPWIAFHAYLIWAWRVYDIFHQVPFYGDTLEVLWGIQWWYESLLKHTSPLFTNLIFYPLGWHTATLAHTPAFFLLAQPFMAAGGASFANNVLTLLAQYIAFAGAYRFSRSYVSSFGATIAALLLSFWHMRWLRVGGHLHILWATALLPWFAWCLTRKRFLRTEPALKRDLLLCGLIWGMMINFSLYSVFLGPLIFLIWGRNLARKEQLLDLLQITIVALLISGPVLLLYYFGAYKDGLEPFDITHTLGWGASLNSLIVPSVYHPVEWIKHFARSVYAGPYSEAGVANLGTMTALLFLIGLVVILREREILRYASLLPLVLMGSLLSLGLLLKWNGEVIPVCALRPINTVIWKAGHLLKPSLFTSAEPEGSFTCGIPMPGLILAALIPFWESARVASRYSFVTILGMAPIAARGLQALPKIARWVIAMLWLMEFLPVPVEGKSTPLQLHPAYTWVTQQIPPGEGILEVQYPSLRIGGEVLYATMLSQVPTASGAGSFWPQHSMALWKYFLTNRNAWREEKTAAILRTYRVRYVLVYRFGEKETILLEEIKRNPQLRLVKCFDPLPGPSPWPVPICVVEVLGDQDQETALLMRTSGWSGEEPWGVWAEGTESEVLLWTTTQGDVRLLIEAFPFCVPGQYQVLSIVVNNRSV